jgi:hypothetical protein
VKAIPAREQLPILRKELEALRAVVRERGKASALRIDTVSMFFWQKRATRITRLLDNIGLLIADDVLWAAVAQSEAGVPEGDGAHGDSQEKGNVVHLSVAS